MLQNPKQHENQVTREDYLKIKRLANGYIVTSLNVPPYMYPELGEIVPHSGDCAMTVGEHIYDFFNKKENI